MDQNHEETRDEMETVESTVVRRRSRLLILGAVLTVLLAGFATSSVMAGDGKQSNEGSCAFKSVAAFFGGECSAKAKAASSEEESADCASKCDKAKAASSEEEAKDCASKCDKAKAASSEGEAKDCASKCDKAKAASSEEEAKDCAKKCDKAKAASSEDEAKDCAKKCDKAPAPATI